MSQNKLLPVNYPDITCFPYYADVLSIVSATSDSYIPWMLSNFIQLSSHPDRERNGILKIDFFQPWITWVPYYCPLIDVQLINKDVVMLKNKLNIISFITESIDLGYYVHMKVNHNYLSISSFYKKKDLAHDILIYGYNKVLETFEVADNFDGKYEFKKCSFKEFEDAYDKPAIYNVSNYEKILLFRANNYAQYSFDLLKVVDSLNDYLLSRDTRIRDDQSLTWASELTLGINIYEKIIEYLFTLLEEKLWCDFKPFHVLWEHKKCMVQRIEFLIKNNLLQESRVHTSYKDLEKKTLIFRNMMLKYLIKPEKKLIQNLIQEIKSFSLLEPPLINEMLDQIYLNSSRAEEILLGNNNNINLKWNLCTR
ncbi:hypothetical protein [Paenibacillus zanthoxyli]|uniref:hypothetical protein n=1 Tax=Paenibacillus zanthoxyli TaxID=369399 RepID=UPI00047034A5|nr:hypothetical protein [Paenibacillus zanthoxyli]